MEKPRYRSVSEQAAIASRLPLRSPHLSRRNLDDLMARAAGWERLMADLKSQYLAGGLVRVASADGELTSTHIPLADTHPPKEPLPEGFVSVSPKGPSDG